MGKGNWLVTVGGSAGAKYATVASRHESYEAAARATVQERARLVERGDGSRCGVESVEQFVRDGGVLPDEAPALRFRCVDCAHRFVSDSEPAGPEGCPECGSLELERVQCEVCGVEDATQIVEGDLPIGPVCLEAEAIYALSAVLLPVLAHAADLAWASWVRRNVLRGPWRPSPRAPRVIVCNYDGERACDADEGLPCPGCVSSSTPRHGTMLPGATDYLAALPPLARRDPSSATWRAMRETAIDTVRPGVSA